MITGEDAGPFVFGYEDGACAVFDGNMHLGHAAEDLRLTLGEALVEGIRDVMTLRGDWSVAFRAFDDKQTDTVLHARTYVGFGGDCLHALLQHVVDALLHGTPLEN